MDGPIAAEQFMVSQCDDQAWFIHTNGDIIAYPGQGDEEKKARMICAALNAYYTRPGQAIGYVSRDGLRALCSDNDTTICCDDSAYGFDIPLYTAAGQEDGVRAALERSMVALDDWLHVYASELCDDDRVKEAQQRIREYGTLSYITNVQDKIREALASLPASGTDSE